MESLYVFMQTIYLFSSLNKFHRQYWSSLLAPVNLVLLVLVWLLFLPATCIKKLLQQGFVFILLICMALGTLFRSASIFLQVLMDPNEYDKLQTKNYFLPFNE